MKKIGIAIFILMSAAFVGCRQKLEVKQLNLYIWSAYISDETVRKFEQTTGIRVRYDTYDSNEALLEKLQSGVSDFDVVVPSDYLVRILVHQNLLTRLDKSRIKGLDNMSKRFQKLPFDPDFSYSIPFLWGTAGIGYDKTKVKGPVDSWAILWDPMYKNRILMLDDVRECFGVALKRKGYSVNTKDSAQLKEAKDLLIQQKRLVKTYTSSNFDEVLMSGDVWLAHGWSGQLAKAADQNPKLAYVIPKEGSTIWVDNMAIPTTAKHIDEAYAFINFSLDPKIAAEISNFSGYANPNESARPYIDPKILNDPARYPDDETLSRCEFIEDLGETTRLMDTYWTEIKSN